MIVAQRFRPRAWQRLLSHLRPFTASAQHVWEDAWLDRCRQRLDEPYMRVMHPDGSLHSRRLNVVNPADYPFIDESGQLYTERTPLDRLATALEHGADPSLPFGLALEGVTREGRRRIEQVLNAEFPSARVQVQARLEDALHHRPGSGEALDSRAIDPLYPALPRHWKEARTALDWCLLLGDDEAIERLGLVHRTLSEQDRTSPRSEQVAVHQASVLSSLTGSFEAPTPAHEARWHRTARRLDDLVESLAKTRLGAQDDPTVPQVARGGDFRTIVDSVEIDALDGDGRHIHQALLEGRDGPVRRHAQEHFWRARYALGDRRLPEAWPSLGVHHDPALTDDRTDGADA